MESEETRLFDRRHIAIERDGDGRAVRLREDLTGHLTLRALAILRGERRS